MLILADNALTDLPPRIGRLRRLRTLDLGHNALTSPPEEVGELTGLDGCLHLHDNRLRTVPPWLGRELPALEKLDLRWNGTVVDPGLVGELERRGCVVLR
ncbi:hypothetical protein [Streptomyces pini]|uniref:Leucine Rich Repeat n=1 Tax=Streptomyces pini TaxID=1520580 RepID=A0A1I4D0U9_9ACTN|nr:hypothetical protein [Streptomyces pini]SFK86490.1 Leucine Rich Repeat [Streptomyces pini]